MTTGQYIPGTCNIGKNEIRQRQIVALIGLGLTIFSFAGFVASSAEPQVRLGIFLPSLVMSVGFIQSRKKFCLAFGFLGTFNFGKLGQMNKVADKASLKADRKTALVILGQAIALAAAVTLVTYILPLS
jgi:hypothetical protein